MDGKQTGRASVTLAKTSSFFQRLSPSHQQREADKLQNGGVGILRPPPNTPRPRERRQQTAGGETWTKRRRSVGKGITCPANAEAEPAGTSEGPRGHGIGPRTTGAPEPTPELGEEIPLRRREDDKNSSAALKVLRGSTRS